MGGRSETWIRKGLARLACLAGLVLFALFAAAPSLAQEKRIALVIGNGTYAEVNSLSNSINDARLLRKTLESLGFDVIYLPPIHPIGHTARKGRNNALTAEEGVGHMVTT